MKVKAQNPEKLKSASPQNKRDISTSSKYYTLCSDYFFKTFYYVLVRLISCTPEIQFNKSAAGLKVEQSKKKTLIF